MIARKWPFLLVGLTGSIGSGKSTCAAMLSDLGAAVVNADQLARKVLEPGTSGAKKVRDTFGDSVFLSPDTLTIDRKALAARIFSNEEERRSLEAIVHPRVRELFLAELEALATRPSPPPVVVYDVPLLFESDNDLEIFDATVAISAVKEKAVQRVVARDRLRPDEVELRLARQMPAEEKERRATYLLKNNGSFQDLRLATKVLYEQLMGQAGKLATAQ